MQTVNVITLTKGKAVLSESAYSVKSGSNVVAFYIDAWGNTGRAYPVCSSSSSFVNGTTIDAPSICFEDGSDDTDELFTEVYFPDFYGYNVHSVSGGKTVAVCLTKD